MAEALSTDLTAGHVGWCLQVLSLSAFDPNFLHLGALIFCPLLFIGFCPRKWNNCSRTPSVLAFFNRNGNVARLTHLLTL